jgi:hypothetical protein
MLALRAPLSRAVSAFYHQTFPSTRILSMTVNDAVLSVFLTPSILILDETVMTTTGEFASC